EVDVVVSTKSGVGLSLQFWQSVLQPLWNVVEEHSSEADGWELPNVLITQDAQSVRRFARKVGGSEGKSDGEPTQSRTIVLLSGDGGIVDLINGSSHDEFLEQRHLLLALLPLGTGNALFHTLHKPLWASKDGKTEDASPLSDTPEYRVHGDKRFGMVAQELLRESHPYSARVDVRHPSSSHWETIPGDKHAYVLMTPLSNLERTFTISPASKPLDGKLRLVHFGTIGGERTLDVMMKAYDEGKHIGTKWDDGHEVRYEEVDEVKVTVLEDDERWRKVCIDGTIVDIPKGGELSVRKEEKSGFQVLVDSRV
ncbi:uncharacterized protein TRIVIDRAFT_127708, partial [Trichoderma virens Gv29-8]